MKIVLTATEQRVFRVLAAVGGSTGTTVRAAGGWVRDKLLGISSNDVDVALDTMDGETFAEAVMTHLKTSESNLKISSIGTIRRNPEKSKHLSTATFVLEGISIDANNLRSEEYSSESRIPVARLGTPKEDAERRDFTVNSLFFNLHTESVEDHTQLGLSDLNLNLLRTPLNPQITFRDDPLRVVRAVRFAAKFRMQMHEDLKTAICDPDIVALLKAKVSGERIGTEIEKMFTHVSTAALAYKLLTSQTPIAKILMDTKDLKFPTSLSPHEDLDERQAKLLFLALLSEPLRTETQGSKNIPSALVFLKDTLHINKHHSETVVLLHTQIPVVARLVHSRELIVTGKLLRLLKDDWTLALRLFASVFPEKAEEVRDLELWIKNNSDLLDCWHWKPPFDGRALAQEPFAIGRGPEMAKAIERQLELMFEGVREPDAIRRKLLNDSWIFLSS
jgi:tRNA nucleotidyltransferase/poly(A) polymerase